MSTHVPPRLITEQLTPGSLPSSTAVQDIAHNRRGASAADARTDPTLHACTLWGRLILKVARVEAKEQKQ
jgi:hypothetical protein